MRRSWLDYVMLCVWVGVPLLVALADCRSHSAHAETPDTRSDIVLTHEQFSEILKHIENLAAIERALPVITLDPIQIVEDQQGRIFVPQAIKGTLSLAYLNYSFTVQTLPTVIRQLPKEKWWRLRYKIVGYANALAPDAEHRFGAALAVEPLHIRLVGVQALVGSTFSGAGLSLDLTRNISVLASGGLGYTDAKPALAFGIAASIN